METDTDKTWITWLNTYRILSASVCKAAIVHWDCQDLVQLVLWYTTDHGPEQRRVPKQVAVQCC